MPSHSSKSVLVRRFVRLVPLLVALVGAMPARAGAQPAARDTPAATIALETGEQIWEAGCASCHGKDGKGQLDLIGFEPPKSFPDFSDCSTSTPESDVQWRAVITHGGRARSFSRSCRRSRES